MEDAFLMLGMMCSWFHLFSWVFLSGKPSGRRWQKCHVVVVCPLEILVITLRSGLRVSGTIRRSSQQQRTQPVLASSCHPNPLLKNTCMASLYVINCILWTREGRFVWDLFQPAPTYFIDFHCIVFFSDLGTWRLHCVNPHPSSLARPLLVR